MSRRRAPSQAATRATTQPAAAASAARQATTAEPRGAASLIVDDGPLQPGQVLASVFRERASAAVRQAVEARMGVMSMFGSPAIDRILAALQTAGGSLEQVVRELAARRADAVTARAALRAAPSPATLGTARAALEALRAAVRAVLEKYLAYHAIPYEEDGHEVGAAAEAAFERSR